MTHTVASVIIRQVSAQAEGFRPAGTGSTASFCAFCFMDSVMKAVRPTMGRAAYFIVWECYLMKKPVEKLVAAALCLALCLVLPFLTGQIPQIGSALCPMHIPVLLCGFVCGWPYALVVGAVAPILRSLLFTMPPMLTAIAMAFELATYGLVSGLLYKLLPKKPVYIYVSLIAAMVAGRVVWGLVRCVMLVMGTSPFTFQAFLAGAFLNAIPGIICHIVLIPVLVMALKKAKLIFVD